MNEETYFNLQGEYVNNGIIEKLIKNGAFNDPNDKKTNDDYYFDDSSKIIYYKKTNDDKQLNEFEQEYLLVNSGIMLETYYLNKLIISTVMYKNKSYNVINTFGAGYICHYGIGFPIWFYCFVV